MFRTETVGKVQKMARDKSRLVEKGLGIAVAETAKAALTGAPPSAPIVAAQVLAAVIVDGFERAQVKMASARFGTLEKAVRLECEKTPA